MAEDKKSFLLYVDNYTKTIGKLSYEQKGRILDAIYHKAGCQHAKSPELDILLQMAFDPIETSMERAAEKYEEVCKKRREAGKKGGRPKGSFKNQSKAKKPNGFLKNQSKAKKPDSDSDNDSDNGPCIKKNISGYSEKFLAFWEEYPKKQGKAGAWKTWKARKLDLISEKIMKSLRDHKQCEQWTKENGKYIPMGSSWISQERYEDEVNCTHTSTAEEFERTNVDKKLAWEK